MAWIEMRLKGQKVLARCDESGQPVAEGGRVEIRYRPKDGRAYRAGIRNLAPIAGAAALPDDHCAPAEASAPTAKSGGARSVKVAGKTPAVKPPEVADAGGPILVYTDGACSGNPGPSGLGVVVLDGETRRELSEYLGRGTNNIAELTAILRAAELLRAADRPIHIYTDSQYAIGVLQKGWKAKKNPELILEIKTALAALSEYRLFYVPGHVGVALNERADTLARDAVSARASREWREG